MTPDERSLLERTYKIAEENNGMLRSIRRSTRFANITRVAYWLIIIGVSIGAYYFIQPYVDFLLDLAGGSISNAQDATNSLQELFQ